MDGSVFLVAADHPARGAVGAGARPTAMENRAELLHCLCLALEQPGVDGVLGTADIIEDLARLGVLDGKIVFGSMNRAGLYNSVFEIDDRFTGYTADGIREAGLEGGKMLLRMDPKDLATPRALESCARAVNELAAHGLTTLVEPFWSRRSADRLENLLTPEAVALSAIIASGLGSSSAHMWLKLPVVADMRRVLDATTLPTLLLGGEVASDPSATYDAWSSALAHPAAMGMVAGRSVLYPADGDVVAAVRTVASIVHPALVAS